MNPLFTLFFLSLLFYSQCSFQINAFSELNTNNKNKNLIFSPISIFQILSLTANGASGTTLEEMLNVLNENNIEEINDINKNILKFFKGVKTVEMTNAIMTKILPLQNFVSISEEYEASLQPLTSVEKVNDWVKEKTHNRITKILDKIDPNTVMILLNAIYFKGKWLNVFTKEMTREKEFYNFGIKPKNVQMMKRKSKHYYYEDVEAQVIKLEYKDDDISAIFILPNKAIDINKFADELTDEKLESYYSKMKRTKVDLEMPKLELEFSSNLDEIIKSMGMREAYTNRADFSKITRNNDIKVNKIVHKAFLKVDEEGTEAAAVTAVVMTVKGMAPMNEIIYEMHINRPFIVLLKAENLPAKHNLLFMAKIEEL